MDETLRSEIRWLWLAVQDKRCGVCGIGVAGRYGYQARWVLDYVRTHDGVTHAKGSECVDCVQGTTCRLCMLHLGHFRKWPGYVPRKPVNGVAPARWVSLAASYTSSDFRSLVGEQATAGPWSGP